MVSVPCGTPDSNGLSIVVSLSVEEWSLSTENSPSASSLLFLLSCCKDDIVSLCVTESYTSFHFTQGRYITPKGLTGDKAEKILEEVGLACNKNAIPYDPNPPKVTSGLRFGTAAATTRGFNQEDFKQVGNMIADILDRLLLSENERQEVNTRI